MQLVTIKDFYGYEAHVYVSDCGTYRLYIHPYGMTSMEYESIHEIRWHKFIDDESDTSSNPSGEEIFHNEFGAASQAWRHDTDDEGDGPGSILGDIDDGTYFIDGETLSYGEWIDKCKLPKERKIELKLKK